MYNLLVSNIRKAKVKHVKKKKVYISKKILQS